MCGSTGHLETLRSMNMAAWAVLGAALVPELCGSMDRLIGSMGPKICAAAQTEEARPWSVTLGLSGQQQSRRDSPHRLCCPAAGGNSQLR